jgi:CheY-like chemotaxis protein
MNSKTATILLVDDSADDLELLKIVFRGLKVPNPINCVQSGGEAIAYLNGEGKFAERSAYPYPNFILTDLNMPDGDGFDLLENLKSHPAKAVVPAVVFSGSDDADDIKKAFLMGANSYFIKPSGLQELRQAVSAVYEYWKLVARPLVDDFGMLLPTESAGKLGERFPESSWDRGRLINEFPANLPKPGPVRSIRVTDEILLARQEAKMLASKAARLKVSQGLERRENLKVLKSSIARSRELANEFKQAALEIDMQIARSRKLLKKRLQLPQPIPKANPQPRPNIPEE